MNVNGFIFNRVGVGLERYKVCDKAVNLLAIRVALLLKISYCLIMESKKGDKIQYITPKPWSRIESCNSASCSLNIFKLVG